MKNITLEDAMKVLIKHLKEDEGYRLGWQSNIAMNFVDMVSFSDIDVDRNFVHRIANEAAINFIYTLCEDVNKEEDK